MADYQFIYNVLDLLLESVRYYGHQNGLRESFSMVRYGISSGTWYLYLFYLSRQLRALSSKLHPSSCWILELSSLSLAQ